MGADVRFVGLLFLLFAASGLAVGIPWLSGSTIVANIMVCGILVPSVIAAVACLFVFSGSQRGIVLLPLMLVLGVVSVAIPMWTLS